MQLLDPALGVAAVAAEVELAARAGRARLGVGPADDADHEVAGGEAAAGGRLEHAAERLVAEDSRSEPGGAQPYSPSMISRSVPQTPSAMPSTSSSPGPGSGSGMSTTAAEPACSGITVSARMVRSLPEVKGVDQGGPPHGKGAAPRRRMHAMTPVHDPPRPRARPTSSRTSAPSEPSARVAAHGRRTQTSSAIIDVDIEATLDRLRRSRGDGDRHPPR